ncbi:MAG TPA: recombinase RecT [Candidatus Paceibacterota bacterium]
MTAKESQIVVINEELNRELADPKVVSALIATTFRKFDATLMKQAIMEGMIRGFSFKDFLQKNVYALPFGEGYSLITSIDYNRKIGMRSGVVGVKAPIYETEKSEDGTTKIISCTVTVQRMVNGYVGDYTATVYFDEYYKAGKTWDGKYTPSMWDTKPRTMIAKVAEMHAYRKACPEELAQSYIEEEMPSDSSIIAGRANEAIRDAKTLSMGNLMKNGKEKEANHGAEDQSANGPTDAEGTQVGTESGEPTIE